MRIFKAGGAAVLLIALLVAGCSPTDEGPSTGVGAEEEPGELGFGQSSTPTLAAQQLSKPFTYQETFSDGTAPVEWEVRVDKVTCGLTLLKNAADNPAYTSGDWSSDDVPPEQIDATPAPGKTFCRMDATMKNVGRTSASSTESFGDLETDKGLFAASFEEQSLAENLLEMDEAPTGPFNPGDTAKVVKIWSAPKAAQPRAVLFPEDTAYDVSAYRIAVA